MNSSDYYANSTVFDIKTWPNAVAAGLMLLNSILGLLFNAVIIHNFISDKQQKTSFNLVCVFRAINNFIVLITMLAVFLPAIILGVSYYDPVVETVIITFAVNLMVFNEFQGIYLAVNRLTAIYFPLKYHLFFGIKLTFFFHILYYADRIRNVTMETIGRMEKDPHEYLLFSIEYLAYGGLLESPDFMFVWALGLILFPFLLNAITYIKIYQLKKKTTRDSEHWKTAKQNMAQFFQTVIQDSLFSVSVIFTMKLNTAINHRFWTFICQTLIWQSVHVSDGFIMLMFNEKLTLFKRKLKVSPLGTVAKQPEISMRNTSTALPDITH